MPSLLELQQRFAESVLHRNTPVLAPYISGPHTEACSLLYSNTVYGTLGKALEAIYPVISRLLGARCFDGVARHFIKHVPSRSGDLHNFGGEFADFLASSQLSSDYPYLPDVARLEWQMHRVFHAADTTPMDVQQLQGVAPERYTELYFTLAPASVLLLSPYPIHLIWQANQAGQDGSAEISLVATRLMLLRVYGAIKIISLSAGEYALLASLQDGNSIGVAVEAAMAVEAGFDPQAVLAREIERGVLTGFGIHSQ